jgi:enoyl-CoA hydratase
MRETKDLPDKEALALEQEIGFPIFLTEDAQEGPRAFAEKRPAVFKGR